MSNVDDVVTTDVFGLAGTFPCPGWRVLDAARDHRFTGEVTCATIPATKVYFDAGRIYLAERVSEPSLGARLVDAGALSAAQLERGSMFVGGVAHLGRLFERAGSVDRQQVLLVAELMTEERVDWLAGRLVAGIELAPYRHHPTGVRRWAWPSEPTPSAAADPLPAPLIGDAPTASSPPESKRADDTPSLPDLESAVEAGDGGTILWDRTSGPDQSGVPAPLPLVAPSAGAVPLRTPDGGESEPGTTPSPSTEDGGELPPSGGHDPVDRFEVIWPSGEIGGQVEPPERVEPPSRVDTEPLRQDARSQSPLSMLHDVAAGGSSVDSTLVQRGQDPTPDSDAQPDSDAAMVISDESSDPVALAVRRAVATIETGSLEARRRFVAPQSADDRSGGDDLRDVTSTPLAGLLRRAPTRSVFDDPDPHEDATPASPLAEAEAVDVESDPDDGAERAGALRRLIDSMRRD